MDEASLWYKTAIFYEINVRAFFDSSGNGIGDLNGLAQKFDYIKELGVDCVWLMPIYPSPLEDGGYDIADYYNVHPDLGTLEDLKKVIQAAHDHEIKVILDLVLNHTSDQHPWFQEGRKDPSSEYHDYYVWSDTDQKYSDTRIIFVDTQRSNWSWDEAAGKYYWHRFYPFQPDLNFDNPAVQQEMFKIMKFWLDLGIDGFRADAVPYLFEREGTNCENLPETHAYLKRIRSFMDEHYPGTILLCEANQWPTDLRPYFGDGDEFHIGFNFPLMPRIFMALKKGDVSDIQSIMAQTPEIPESCHWCTFLRNHDELTLEMVTPEERDWMWQQYAPEPRMRLNLGIRRRLAPLLDQDNQKIGLAMSILFTLPGAPIIYYGDEIGMGDNIWLPDRDGVRTPMQWEDSINGGFSKADPDQLFHPVIDNEDFPLNRVNVAAHRDDPESLFNLLRKMIQAWKSTKALMFGDLEWADVGEDKHIAAYFRTNQDEVVLIVNNFSAEKQIVKIEVKGKDLSGGQSILTGKKFDIEGECLKIELQPYQYYWIRCN